MSKSKKPTLSARIRDLFKKGYERKEIETKLGVSPQLIYAVAKKEGLVKKKKKKSSSIIKAVKETTAEIQKVKADPVNSPPHYKAGGFETIDFIEAKDLNYRLGNVIKYVSRAGKKDSDPLVDLKKARWYLDREIFAREGA